jgi:hypothetical protein
VGRRAFDCAFYDRRDVCASFDSDLHCVRQALRCDLVDLIAWRPVEIGGPVRLSIPSRRAPSNAGR